jgi:hypothetical protein
MTTQKFKADEWVKFTEVPDIKTTKGLFKIVEVDENSPWMYKLDNNRWVSDTNLEPLTTPELIAHLEGKSNELIQVEFAAKNERHEIDRQIHLLKTNTEML